MTHNTITEHLLTFLDDYHSFNATCVPDLPFPTPVEFAKQVSKGLPCKYLLQKGSGVTTILDVPAWSWTRQTLISCIRDAVDVAVTPDGRADALCTFGSNEEKVFVQPATIQMSLSDLLDELCSNASSQTKPVYYLQSQNSNLTTTSLAPLLSDLPSNIPFADQVLAEPEAINIWIGNEQSVTSTHRDPYENLYLVLRGSKTFTLWAPVDEVAMDGQSCHIPTVPKRTTDPSHSHYSPHSPLRLRPSRLLRQPRRTYTGDSVDTHRPVPATVHAQHNTPALLPRATPDGDSQRRRDTLLAVRLVPPRHTDVRHMGRRYHRAVHRGQLLVRHGL